MRMKYKIIIILVLIGFLSISITTVIFFRLNRKTELDIVASSLNLTTNDRASLLRSELEGLIGLVVAVSQTPLVLQGLETENRKYADITDTDIQDLLIKLDTEWTTSDIGSTTVNEVLNHPISDYFGSLKRIFCGTIGEIFITNKYGIAIASTNKLTTRTHSNKYWWNAVNNNSNIHIYIDDRGFDESVDGYVLGIVLPVRTDTEIIGTVKINFNIEPFLKGIVRNSQTDGIETIIIRSEGLIVKAYNKEPLSNSVSEEALNAILETLGGTFIDEKENRIVSSITLEFEEGYLMGGSPESADHKLGNPGEPWILVNYYDMDVALRSIKQRMNYVILIEGFILITVIFASFILNNIIMKPITNMTNVLAKIGRGNLALRLETKESGELGILAQALNTMMDDISKITASKDDLEKEIQLRHLEEEKYKMLFTSMSEGFASHKIILDKNGTPIDYVFLSINPKFEEILGIDADHVIGKRVLDVFPDLEPFWIETYGEIALTGQPFQFEHYFAAQNKYYNISAFRPRAGEFAVTFLDVSKRVLAEKTLEKEKEFLATTFNSIADGIVTSDEKGTILYMNPISERMTEWNKLDAVGHNFDDVIQIVDENNNLKCSQSDQNSSNEKEMSVAPGKKYLISKTGIKHSIDCNSNPIRDSAKNVLGFITVFQDISEKNKLQEQLLQKSKMDVVGQLAGGIAHDFNNVLSGIISSAQLLKMKQQKLNKKALSYVDMILKVANRASSLTSKLLAFSRNNETSFKPVDLHKLIVETEEILLNTINKNIQIQIGLNADFFVVSGDENELHNSLLNLCINASQAMPSGGTLIIRTGNCIYDEEYQVNEFKLDIGNYCWIEIVDSGIGISENNISSIFEPFFSTKSQGEGTGLGLAAVYGMVLNHKGLIEVESKIEKGTTFKLFLPITNSISELEDKEIMKSGRGVVLFVDDEKINRVLASDVLDSIGYEAITASGGLEALKIYKNNQNSIDIIIIDFMMPDMNGAETFMKMREINPKCKIILSSGYSDNEEIQKIRQFGLNGQLKKPYRIEELSQLLESVLS